MAKKFCIQDGEANTVAGMNSVGEDNPYVSSYGTLLPGQRKPGDLEVGELTRKRYALSGQRPTTYVIVRVE